MGVKQSTMNRVNSYDFDETIGKYKPNEYVNIAKLHPLDMQFLVKKTGLSKDEINNLFKKFMDDNPTSMLDRNKFNLIYKELKGDENTNSDKIADYVFRAFDLDRNGYITLNEFVIGFALISKGDLKTRLEYSFNLYDLNFDGFIEKHEAYELLTKMFHYFNIEKSDDEVKEITDMFMSQLDTNPCDGKVSKDEFINGLLKNEKLCAISIPFY